MAKPAAANPSTPTTSWDARMRAVPRVLAASFLCSAAIIELTIPQIVRLSAASAHPLPHAPLPVRLKLFAGAISPQTALTVVQFAIVREARLALDTLVGKRGANVGVVYGLLAVPFTAAKYNLLTADVFAYHKVKLAVPNELTRLQTARRFWQLKVVPGFAWSFMRDANSIGGAIVLGPVVARAMARALEGREQPRSPVKFASGLVSGSICGFATQWAHNAALTAGRIAELHGSASAIAGFREVFSEHGARALVLNFPFRVGLIASWSAVLNVTEPFE